MASVDASSEIPEAGLPLRDDIRLLGRILGDTVREQQGEAVFDLVERIRQTSIRFHRTDDEAARRELEALLNGLRAPRATLAQRPEPYFMARMLDSGAAPGAAATPIKPIALYSSK